MSTDTQVYRYAGPSVADAVGGSVALATSGGVALRRPSAHPHFFSGFLTDPDVAAEALRAVATVAASNFVNRPPALLDPVVTSNGDRLRFESFSSCCGVQARLDLLADALDGDLLDRGTTNVDVNEALRRFLAKVGPNDTLHLNVGAEELVVSGPGQRYAERRVRLPSRWLRGFAEVQAIASTSEPRVELAAHQASSFIASLPKASSGWVVPAGRSWRLSARPSPGAVFLAGTHRLAALVPLLRHGSRLRGYGPTVGASSPASPSAWEVELPGARLTFVLSPDPWRGFSGEGANLERLSTAEAATDADTVHAAMAFEPRLEFDSLAAETGLTGLRVRDAVAHLAVSGRVGYDLAEAAYFHRELPFDPAAAETMNPRLRDARALVAADAITIHGAVAEVVSSDTIYRVRDRGDGTYACTCRWWTTHRGERGPCKHVLAVTMLNQARLA